MKVRETPCKLEYPNQIGAKSIYIDGVLVGDIAEFHSLGDGHHVILTHAMRPYSNAHFATHEGALNYMRLVAQDIRRETARPAKGSSSVECPHCRWGFWSPAVLDQHIREKHS